MTETALGWWGVPLAVFAGAMRSSTPFLFVSLGELLTEKSGRINLGQEGILVLGAMCGYGVAFLTGSPWLGVLVAGCAGAVLGSVHAALCSLPRVNDIALGIAIMLFGTGLAFYLGKPFIQPQAPRLPAIPFGWWSSVPQVQAALQVNVLFLLGAGLCPRCSPGDSPTRAGGSSCRRLAIAPTRLGPWATPCTVCAGRLPLWVASWPGSAARFCPCTIRAVGMRGCRVGRD